MDYEQEAAALYVLPPAQFTTARDVRIAEHVLVLRVRALRCVAEPQLLNGFSRAVEIRRETANEFGLLAKLVRLTL